MPLSRRQFLKLSALSMLAVAAGWHKGKLPPEDAPAPEVGLGRVMAGSVVVRREPNAKADIVARKFQDQLINLRRAAVSEGLPEHNRLWYEVAGGFIHSGWVQPVRYDLQQPLATMPAAGFIAEVSVPFTDSRALPHPYALIDTRLYFGSAHWVTGIFGDELNQVWYKVLNDRHRTASYVRAGHLRAMLQKDLAPLSLSIFEKRLEVDIAAQIVTAYENDQPVFAAPVATGDWFEVKGVLKDYTTPRGEFHIQRKTPSRHMAAGDLAAGEGYDLPGVPWVSYFTASGVAFHGTYWHNDYGRPRSHGCVNLTPEAAKWIYRWSTPIAPADDTYVWGDGTEVIVL